MFMLKRVLSSVMLVVALTFAQTGYAKTYYFDPLISKELPSTLTRIGEGAYYGAVLPFDFAFKGPSLLFDKKTSNDGIAGLIAFVLIEVPIRAFTAGVLLPIELPLSALGCVVGAGYGACKKMADTYYYLHSCSLSEETIKTLPFRNEMEIRTILQSDKCFLQLALKEDEITQLVNEIKISSLDNSALRRDILYWMHSHGYDITFEPIH